MLKRIYLNSNTIRFHPHFKSWKTILQEDSITHLEVKGLNINLRAIYSNKQGEKLRFICRKYRSRILKTAFFQAEDLSYLFFIRFFFLFNGSSLSFRHNRGRLRGLEFFSSLDIVKQKGKLILCRIRSCCHE